MDTAELQSELEAASTERSISEAAKVNHPCFSNESWEEHFKQMQAQYGDICVRVERSIGLESGLKELLQRVTKADETGDPPTGTAKEPIPATVTPSPLEALGAP